jgi:hypothetical protein
MREPTDLVTVQDLLDFEERSGWLVAGVARSGWLVQLRPEQLLVWRDALAGFYKYAGVDLVREQIAHCLPNMLSYTVVEQGLVVQPTADTEELYDLSKDPDQVKNVAAEASYARSRKDLAARLLAVLQEAGDPRVVDEDCRFEWPPFTAPEPVRKPKK